MVRVGFDAIPSTLKQRDQWLLWDASADTPRRPHWDGDFAISWSDPDEWHTFADARELAKEHESWGIGYVTGIDNDAHGLGAIGVIDIDTGYVDGELADWVPELNDFDGAYIERSPSGQGLHIPFAGYRPPDWWSDSQMDEHTGVDVLTNKFCTFTGDTIQDGDVFEGDPTEWLFHAYKAINGETPRIAADARAETTTNTNDEWLDESDVEDALSHIDPDVEYSTWRNIGFGLHDFFDGSHTGKQLFQTWSRGGTKFDSTAEDYIDAIWSSAGDSGNKVTIATVIHHAKQGGWSVPTASTDGGTATQSASSGSDHLGPRKHGAPIEVDNGQTQFKTWSDGEEEKIPILNFEFDIQSILRMDGREVIDASLRQNGHVHDSVQFEPRDLQKKQRFKDNVLADKFGLTFDTSYLNDEKVLNALNQYILEADVPIRTGTHHIGLHGDEWVTPSGSLTNLGWSEDPQTIYVERNVALERAFSLPTDADFDIKEVAEILTSLPKTRDPSRMIAVLGWFYAAPLRPLIFDDWGAGSFNHLNITGDTGSGKTTTLRYLWRCFGVDSDPFAVTDTKFAMLTALSASKGAPVWYDEYKPSEIQDYRLDQFHDLYRKAATGGTATRGRADQTTEEYHIHAPVVVSGEEQIRRPAERRRSIMVAFREDVTKAGTETRETFKRLVGEGKIEDGKMQLPENAPDPTNHALAYYRWITAQDRQDLREHWIDARELVWKLRQNWESQHDLDDMEVQGLRTIAFGWKIMKAFADANGVPASELPDKDDLDAALQHVATEIGPDGQRKSHMDGFVELFERAAAADYLEAGQHYKVIHEGKSSEELRINLRRAYDVLSRYARDHDLSNEELLSNANDYQKRFREAAEKAQSYVRTHSQNTPPIGRCVGISTLQAMRELDFDRNTFDLKAMGEKAPQQDLIDTVRSTIATHASSGDGFADRQTVIDALADNHDEDRLKNAIDNLLARGVVYEGENGGLAPT